MASGHLSLGYLGGNQIRFIFIFFVIFIYLHNFSIKPFYWRAIHPPILLLYNCYSTHSFKNLIYSYSSVFSLLSSASAFSSSLIEISILLFSGLISIILPVTSSPILRTSSGLAILLFVMFDM